MLTINSEEESLVMPRPALSTKGVAVGDGEDEDGCNGNVCLVPRGVSAEEFDVVFRRRRSL
jgi:hypothetical protein